MRISDIAIPNSAILLEANVLNVKDLYADVSVIAYATKYAKHIEDKALSKSFVIKFGKLMVNDDRWHKAVRQLPDDAPDWAKTAFTNRDLVFFHPNQQLNQQLEHITHYLEAVGADANGTDPDLKIRAVREKSAFLKVANFDEMVKRSNDWFVGSTKSKVSVDGMTEIAKTGQFTWYILQDQAAFKREGKMMQNCLGSHWTLASATNSGQSIVIMRKSNGESVVAARILNNTNEIVEMKGKQNKAPVDEYMGGVLSFIRQRKLIVGKNATNDFERAGYFSIEDKLYTRAEAIEKFLHKEKIGVVGDRQLIRISFKAEMAHLMKEAYPAFKSSFYQYESKIERNESIPDINIYELRDGSGHADIAALVVDKEIINVNRSERQADTPAINENITTQSSETLALIEELFKRKLADRVNNKVNQNVFWNDSMAFDAAGKLEKTKHANIKHSKKGHDWKHHTEAGEIHAAHTEFTDDPEETWNRDDSGLSRVDRSNIHSYYITKHKKRDEKRLDRGHIAAMRTYHGHSVTVGDDKDASVSKDLKARGKLFPHRLDTNSVYGIRTNGQVSIHTKPMLAASRHSTSKPGMKDHKTIDSLMDLANEENLDLPGAFKVNSGIQTDKEGKHSKYVPTPTIIDADGKEKKYNLSNITNNLEKVVAFEKIATSLDVRPWTGETFDNVPNPDHRENDVNSAKGIKTPGSYRSTQYGVHLEDDSRDIDVEKIKQHYHGKDFPDDIYTLSTEYGADKKHDIMMLVKNNEIYQIDSSTTRHPFQHWGDHEEIAKQINKFAADHGLKIKRRFLNRMNSEELRNGKEGITTASELVKNRLAKMEAEGTTGREGTDSLPMANGSKVVKLGAEEQADYLRKDLDLNSVPGQGWKVVDADGNVKGTFFVKRDKVMSIYSGHNQIRDRNADNVYTFIDKPPSADLPKNKGFGQKMMPELKGAMQAFGWEISPKLHFKVDTHLRNQSRRLRKMTDGRNHNTTDGTAQNELSKKLKDRGFVDSVPQNRRGSERNIWKINQRGRNYHNALNDQSSKMHWGRSEHNDHNNPPTAHFDHAERAAAVQFDYVVPEKKAKPEKKKKQRTASTTDTTSTATPRSGSKAGQALDLFRQHVTDHDEMPSRSDFINILQDEPFNMGKAGASTYYANTKKKYSALNEKYSVLAALELMVENYIFLEDWI